MLLDNVAINPGTTVPEEQQTLLLKRSLKIQQDGQTAVIDSARVDVALATEELTAKVGQNLDAKA